MAKHKVRLSVAAWYPGDVEVTPQSLAETLGDLRYDSLGEYLDALAEKLQRDADGDGGRGRGQLAAHLMRAAWALDEAKLEIQKAWKICEPYMKKPAPPGPCMCGHPEGRHLDEISGGARWCDEGNCPCRDYIEQK